MGAGASRPAPGARAGRERREVQVLPHALASVGQLGNLVPTGDRTLVLPLIMVGAVLTSCDHASPAATTISDVPPPSADAALTGRVPFTIPAITLQASAPCLDLTDPLYITREGTRVHTMLSVPDPTAARATPRGDLRECCGPVDRRGARPSGSG
jgi:hypothetical protein